MSNDNVFCNEAYTKRDCDCLRNGPQTRPGNAPTLVEVIKEIDNLTSAATDAAKRVARTLFAGGVGDKQEGWSR